MEIWKQKFSFRMQKFFWIHFEYVFFFFPLWRYEFGSAIFIAWAGAFLTVVGGAMLAASCPRGKSTPRYPMSKPPSSKEYVWLGLWVRGWRNTPTFPLVEKVYRRSRFYIGFFFPKILLCLLLLYFNMLWKKWLFTPWRTAVSAIDCVQLWDDICKALIYDWQYIWY